ncbi:uncharacterized protein LOC126844180 [Adelges cooleyi]|uniref:uncharacterized protein LOC126844180 n=1 Tax=Adelges cooleyi TaxID=133065 RepID=UPI00217F8CF4|nr:uncharacterized protein LOC126844180 [Adelges cooleyi]
MDGPKAILFGLLTLQMYSVADVIVSLVKNSWPITDEDLTTRLQTLIANVSSLASLYLTALQVSRLRQVRHTMCPAAADGIPGAQGQQSVDCHRYTWVIVTIIGYTYLKWAQVSDQVDGGWYKVTAAVLTRTIAVTVNCYVINLFIDHVVLAKRLLKALNTRVENLYGLTAPYVYVGNDISTIRSAYIDIRDACIMIMQVFQTQLFLNIAGNMYGITFMMLTAFNQLMSDKIDSFYITLSCLYESIVRAFQLYFMVNACYTTAEQANQISITLQQKVNEFYLSSYARKKVQLFILEMLDLKTEFIIYGFIRIDFEKFVSLMGSISTYLLILVQFRSSPDSMVKLNETTTTTESNN